jgi:dihydroorotase-like cyclic amidohydrolase
VVEPITPPCGTGRWALPDEIANGTIVTADGSYQADVLVEGETIAQIGANLAEAGVTADETIDAGGKYVIPGGIDAHTHMELPFGGTFAKDTFETGTRAAAFGGTTTIVDFAVQSKGQPLHEGLGVWHEKAAGNAVVDYGFHMIMSDVNDATLAEMDQLVDEGVPDFKLFYLPGDAADEEERRHDPDARRERAGHRHPRGRAGRRRHDGPAGPRPGA